MRRRIIEIDEEKCDGCALCIPACPEGAIQMIDGKARMVSDFYCDGLGACLGHCPQGAISVIEREAGDYDEGQVMQNVIAQGQQAIIQHLQHLREHGETENLKVAMAVLQDHQVHTAQPPHSGGCPGSRNQTFRVSENDPLSGEEIPSALSHWPIQMHLISPLAPQYQGADLLLAADCVAFSMGNFHQKYLKGKTLAIACPKLDQGMDVYLQKLIALIKQAGINSLSVMVMQVPCCSGLVQLARQALQESGRIVPLTVTVVGVKGEILQEVALN